MLVVRGRVGNRQALGSCTCWAKAGPVTDAHVRLDHGSLGAV